MGGELEEKQIGGIFSGKRCNPLITSLGATWPLLSSRFTIYNCHAAPKGEQMCLAEAAATDISRRLRWDVVGTLPYDTDGSQAGKADCGVFLLFFIEAPKSLQNQTFLFFPFLFNDSHRWDVAQSKVGHSSSRRPSGLASP